MRRLTTAILFTAFAFLALSSIESKACSNVLVTKGASTDGSNIISYAADSHQLYGELYFRKAGAWKPGDMRKVDEWDSGKHLGYIPEIAYTYQRVGNMNEHQLIIAETTYGGRSELFDSTGIMDYGSLIYVALERAKTARGILTNITLLTSIMNHKSTS